MRWREWPKTAWGYWDHTPITVGLVMALAVVMLPVTIWFFVGGQDVGA